MSYQQGYVQDQYADYLVYGGIPNTPMYQTQYAQQQQHPTVVIPQQSRPDYSTYQTSSPQLQSHQQPAYYQQHAPQYSRPSPQQYYYPQSPHVHAQSLPQQPVQYQTQSSYQPPHQPSFSQDSYYQSAPSQPQSSYAYQPVNDPWHTDLQHQLQDFLSQPQKNLAQPNPQRPAVNPTHGYVHPQSQPVVRSRPETTAQESRTQQSDHQAIATVHPAQLQKQPQPQQRVVARVEIPVHQQNTSAGATNMPRSPKRRRSNEGRAIPVCDAPVPQERSVSNQPKHAVVSSSPLTELNSSQLPPTPQPSVNYQSTLLALADEYTAAAYSISTSLAAPDDSEAKKEMYYTLISTAMGCLESVLKNFRQLDPRDEARIRLRLGSMMVEETENDEQAEEILSKGVALCERSRLQDLKYAMHHHLVRLLFRSSPKAALKAVDKFIQEVETFGLPHWTYAFRFMRISLSLQMGATSEMAAILKQLSAIASTAEEQRHIAVQIIAAVLEALVHLRTGATDAVELAQRAMAAARTHQLGPDMQRMPQARGLLDCLDLACSLTHFNPDQVVARLQQMHANMDTDARDSVWIKDGTMLVELASSSNEYLEKDTCGIIRRDKNGQASLVLQWISKSHLYTLGYLLSGIANMYRNHSDGKAESYLSEGLKLAEAAPDNIARSLMAATESADRQSSLHIALRLHLIFAWCGRYEWTAAQKAINDLRTEFATLALEVGEDTVRMLLYLEACCRQGLGELRSALGLYRSPVLAFSPDSKASAEKDIRVLSSLSSVFISRTLGPVEFAEAANTMNAIESYCMRHTNKSLFAAYHVAKATAQKSDNANLKTKQYLQHAVSAAKTALNNQLLAIVMIVMTDTFFTNVVTDQAQKSAGVGRKLATQNHDKLWTAVADGMYADKLEKCGRAGEAEATRREARSLMRDLPEALRQHLQTNVL